MANGKLCIAAALCLSCFAAVCGADQKSSGDRTTLIQAGNGEWRLEASQASLPKLLDEIAARTGSKLHYTALPEGAVDATCVGSSVRGLLQCLLGSGVDMAFRHAEKASGVQADEVWIMGSSLANLRSISGQCAKVSPPATVNDSGKTGLTEQWLRQAIAKDPKQRAQAIAELAGADSAFDGKILATLQNALSDKNALVRAQAIGALASREGGAAIGEQLRQALGDSNAEVRLMAVDNIEQDAVLLQMAAQDTDPAVRGMAEAKLEQLAKQ